MPLPHTYPEMNIPTTDVIERARDAPVPADARALGGIALLASGGTLVCCALPIALVTLGFGATVAAMTSSFPVLITLSTYKIWIFGASAALMAATAWSLWRPGRACPADPVLAARCRRATRWSRRLLSASGFVWGIGFFAAYLALPIRIWLGV